MVTLPLPEELQGKPLKIVVEEEEAAENDSKISVNDFLKKYTGILKDCDIESVEAMEEETVPTKRSTMREFVAKYSGILKDCGIESVEAMKEDRINDRIRRHQ